MNHQSTYVRFQQDLGNHFSSRGKTIWWNQTPCVMLYICIPLKSCLWMCCKTQCWKSMILCYFMSTTKYKQSISQPTQEELFYNKWLYENMKQLIMPILKLELVFVFSFFWHHISCKHPKRDLTLNGHMF